MTVSEAARHGRAELEAIVSGLQVEGLARLLEVARHLLEEQDTRRSSDGVTAPPWALDAGAR